MSCLPRTAPVLALSGLLLSPLHGAITVPDITVDPGPIGTMFTDFSTPVTDLNGQLLNGETLNIQFVFTGLRELRFDVPPVTTLTVTLTISSDSTGFTDPFVDFVAPIDTVLTDGSGGLVRLRDSVSIDNPGGGVLSLVGLFNGPVTDEVGGVYMQLTLPEEGGASSITGATFHIALSSTDGKVTVIVPEPGALALLALSGLGLLWRRRA